jgi:hypothetical protein
VRVFSYLKLSEFQVIGNSILMFWSEEFNVPLI